MSNTSEWPGLSPRTKSHTLAIGDLEMHILEAFPENSTGTEAPLVVLLHGFPEIAYSWRKVIGPLFDAGYHVVAPDSRGYGRTKSSGIETVKYEDDLNPYRMTNLVKAVVGLVYTLGYQSAAAVVGHDFGSVVAAHCALIRPDIFKSVVLMSAPFTGPPKLRQGGSSAASLLQKVAGGLAALDPPRKHYMLYYSTPQANVDLMNAPGGLHAFMREYFHVKSADWEGNKPHELALEASALAEVPPYYVMPLHKTMPEAVHGFGPSADEIAHNSWLTEEDLGVYVREYGRRGFQGGLNAYRIGTSAQWSSDCELFDGKRIEVPAMYLAGKQDWGTHQIPGAAAAMKNQACKNMEDFVLIDGAGHWAQLEQSGEVVKELLRFFKKCTK
ncbi:alpha/beta-hydrolase [Mycena vitilis]|nr:alpha/beta-hydrolase [Mycena vitilis]